MFTIGELVFGWPQIVVLAIWVLALGYTAAHEGEPKKVSKHSLAHSLVAVGIVFFILWWGGFYT